MSRLPASYSMTWVRGATVEESFTYKDDDGVAIDLTGYTARMQVRTLAGEYGTSTTDTLLLELSSEGADPALALDPAEGGVLTITLAPAAHAALNPDNRKKVKYAYAIELASGDTPARVIPMVQGKVTVRGEVTR